jgi:hypothetical protein
MMNAKTAENENRTSRPTHRTRLTKGMLALACSGLLACGGDPFASGGISGTGVSSGPITAFGSAFVTGVEWELDRATLELDGEPGDERDLRIGMVVRIEGTLSDDGTRGEARRLIFDDSVEGVISDDPVDVDPGVERSFTVLGMTIVIHATDTSYDDGASFDGLSRFDVVEVSGLLDETGAIRATRVELKGVFVSGVSEAELRGTVTNLNKNPDGTGIFDLGPVTVRYTAATEFDDGLSRASLAEGDFVEAEGVLDDLDELLAESIELEDEGLGFDDADKLEIRGFVTGFTSLADPFMVAGVTVDGSDAELSPPGFVPANGDEVEVEGPLVDGVLRAEEIESEEEDDEVGDEVRMDAEVESTNVAARSLVILGLTVETNGGTRIEDKRDDDPLFRFADIEAGDWLEVEGRSVEGRIVADEIEREDPDDDVILRGPVTSFDALVPSLAILGRDVPIHAGTEYEDGTLNEGEFFALLEVGDVVKAKDEEAVDGAALLQADTVDFED